MRYVFLALALACAAPAAVAQVTAERLFPLAVGDRWEYTYAQVTLIGPVFNVNSVIHREVVGDTLIGGNPWAVIAQLTTDEDGAPLSKLRVYARATGGTLQFSCIPSCSNSVPYWSDTLPTSAGPGNVTIQGTVYPVDALGETSRMVGVSFDNNTLTRRFAADIGLVYMRQFWYSTFVQRTYTYTLRSAVVGGEVYGGVTGTGGPAPDGAALALAVAPNPVRGMAVLRLSLPEAGGVRVEAYDALGRRVYDVDLGAQPAGARTVALGTATWAPGAYVVRVTTGDGRIATARVVRTE